MSVRSSVGDIVQFDYGGDNLDPACMEGKDIPVDFPRTMHHIQVIIFLLSFSFFFAWYMCACIRACVCVCAYRRCPNKWNCCWPLKRKKKKEKSRKESAVLSECTVQFRLWLLILAVNDPSSRACKV